MVSARKDNKRKKGETPLPQIKNKIKILKWVYCIMEEANYLLIEMSKHTWWVEVGWWWGGGGVGWLGEGVEWILFTFYKKENRKSVSTYGFYSHLCYSCGMPAHCMVGHRRNPTLWAHWAKSLFN